MCDWELWRELSCWMSQDTSACQFNVKSRHNYSKRTTNFHSFPFPTFEFKENIRNDCEKNHNNNNNNNNTIFNNQLCQNVYFFNLKSCFFIFLKFLLSIFVIFLQHFQMADEFLWPLSVWFFSRPFKTLKLSASPSEIHITWSFFHSFHIILCLWKTFRCVHLPFARFWLPMLLCQCGWYSAVRFDGKSRILMSFIITKSYSRRDKLVILYFFQLFSSVSSESQKHAFIRFRRFPIIAMLDCSVRWLNALQCCNLMRSNNMY